MNQTTSGADLREEGHRKHTSRARYRRDIAVAQHAVIDRCLKIGWASAPNFDGLLPPAESGNRTYVGTAFTELRRAGIIRSTGMFVTNAGGRHSNIRHTWKLAVGAAAAKRWKRDNPIPVEPEPEPESEG